jgi:hypothetical protein
VNRCIAFADKPVKVLHFTWEILIAIRLVPTPIHVLGVHGAPPLKEQVVAAQNGLCQLIFPCWPYTVRYVGQSKLPNNCIGTHSIPRIVAVNAVDCQWRLGTCHGPLSRPKQIDKQSSTFQRLLTHGISIPGNLLRVLSAIWQWVTKILMRYWRHQNHNWFMTLDVHGMVLIDPLP